MPNTASMYIVYYCIHIFIKAVIRFLSTTTVQRWNLLVEKKKDHRSNWYTLERVRIGGADMGSKVIKCWGLDCWDFPIPCLLQEILSVSSLMLIQTISTICLF